MLKSKCPVRLISLMLLACLLIPCLSPVASAAESQAVSQSAQNTITVSRVRYKAKTNATIIGCLENGTKLNVLGSTKYYYKIDCFDMVGYIAKTQVIVGEDGNYYVRCLSSSPETTTLESASAESALAVRTTIRSYASKFIGVKYVWGGTSPKGFDCSGFTQYVFKHSDYTINRNCNKQLQNGVIVAKEDLQCGDLVFFKNTTGNKNQLATHVGIYIGNNQMIHASSSKGITIVSLDNSYFVKHFLCARRVVLTDSLQETLTANTGVNQNINSSFWRDNAQT